VHGLALNGAEAAAEFLGDEIDPGVGTVEIGPRRSPFGPKPDIGEPFPVHRVDREVFLHQALEEPALLGLGPGNGPYVVQHPLKAVNHSVNRLWQACV